MDLVSVALTLALLLGPASIPVATPAATTTLSPEGSSMALAHAAAPSATQKLPHAPFALLAPPPAAAPDAWLGEDKFRHFLMSFAVTTYAYAGARSVTGHEGAAAVALGAGAAAGLGKELYDRAAGRPFSLRDLAADGLGMLAAWVLVRNTR